METEEKHTLPSCFNVETCSMAVLHKSSVSFFFFFFSENAQDVVQHILDLLLDATLDMKELETIANKISDVVNLEDISVTLAEDVLTILNYILLQETEDKNIRKMTNM